jgi:hypothetical protein
MVSRSCLVGSSDGGIEAARGTVSAFAGATEGNHENLSVAGVPAEILTKHLPNTSLGSYRYANPFVPFAVL